MKLLEHQYRSTNPTLLGIDMAYVCSVDIVSSLSRVSLLLLSEVLMHAIYAESSDEFVSQRIGMSVCYLSLTM